MLLLLMPLGRVLTLPLAGGAIALSGQAAGFSLTEPLGCGAFALSGETAAFRRTRIFPAAFGSFSVIGEPVGAGFAKSSSCGFFSVIGEPVGAGFAKSSSCGFFTLLGEPAYLFVSYPVPPAATAKFSWHMQGLSPIVAAPARATFYWKV